MLWLHWNDPLLESDINFELASALCRPSLPTIVSRKIVSTQIVSKSHQNMKSEIVGKAQQHQNLFENWEKLLFPKQFVERDEINTGFVREGIWSFQREGLHQGCNIVCGASLAKKTFSLMVNCRLSAWLGEDRTEGLEWTIGTKDKNSGQKCECLWEEISF